MKSSLINGLRKSLKLINASKPKEAVDYLKHLAAKHPKNTDPLNLIAELCIKDLADFETAHEALQKSIELNNKDAMSYFYLGICEEKRKDLKQAFEAYKRAHDLDPQSGPVLHCLSRILHLHKHHAASIHFGKKAIQFLPHESMLHSDLAYMCHSLGMSDEALEHLKKCMVLEPQLKVHPLSAIFIAHKLEETSLAELQTMATEINNKFLQANKQNLSFDHSKRYDPNKKTLRLGFLSADFKTHPAGYNLISILEKLDKSRFEINLYFNGEEDDFMTEKFKACANKFTRVIKLSDEEVAQEIYNDQVDFLFDLSGFTAGERLRVMAYKPAPVQATHLGYFGTLGIPEIDYVLADHTVVKEGEEKFYTEKVYKMPNSYVHCQLAGIPEHSIESPCIKNGYVTFGSFNTFHKISKKVLLSWIELLKAVPDSKLLFDSRSMLEKTDLDFFKEFFTARGIQEERLILRSNILRKDFLQSYNDVDIGLDPFPYSGGSTTIEALSMGVPVVTIIGNKWSGRMSSSILQNIGHPELITQNIEEYKTKLIELANNQDLIQNYRQSLREDIENSPMRIEQYVKEFEQAIIDMWKQKSC